MAIVSGWAVRHKYRRAADEEVFDILKQRREGAGFIGTDGGEICHAQADRREWYVDPRSIFAN